MVAVDRYEPREDKLIIDLVRQTTEAPSQPPGPLSKTEQAAFRGAVLERLAPDQRDAAAEALRHPDEVTKEPYAEGYCRFGIAELDTLLAKQPEEAARLYKGLHSPAT